MFLNGIVWKSQGREQRKGVSNYILEMQDFHHGFTEARQMNMEVNWLQAAERFITSLLELHFSQK